MTNSSVNQILVTKGNQALIAADKVVTDLLPGQLGFFNADTRMSITTAADAAKANRILIAVGIDTNGGSVSDDFRYQAGECLQKKNMVHLNYNPASAGRAEKYRITGLKANCNADYLLKIQFTGPSVTELNTAGGVYKEYAVKTSCCTDCATGCYQGSCVELAVKLKDALLNDSEKLFTAKLIDGAGAEITDITAWATANPTLCPGIEIEGILPNIQAKCGINFNYDKVREVFFTPYLTSGFECAGTVTQVTTAKLSSGEAYDLARMEYIAMGWKNQESPYRLLGNGVQQVGYSIVDNTKKYDTFWLQYFYKIDFGTDHENPLQTCIAIPEADTTTRDAVAALFVNLFPIFDSLVDDTAAASTTGTVVEPDVTSENTDGQAG